MSLVLGFQVDSEPKPVKVEIDEDGGCKVINDVSEEEKEEIEKDADAMAAKKVDIEQSKAITETWAKTIIPIILVAALSIAGTAFLTMKTPARAKAESNRQTIEEVVKPTLDRIEETLLRLEEKIDDIQ